MPDITITELINALNSASEVLSSDNTMVVTGGAAKKVTIETLTDTKNITVTPLVIVDEVTDFPAANVTDIFQATSDGWLGGSAGNGLYVNTNDLLYCNTTTDSGNYAAVGQYWNIIRFIIAQPDGYRYIDSLTNTGANVPTGIVDGFYWLDHVLYKVEDSVATQMIVGTGDMVGSNNLSELTDASDARDNLGLGTAAVADIGTGSTEAAAGDHTHAGYGVGDVIGPATNSADYVPQWNGTADSKTLVDGFPITAAGKAILDDADAAAQRTTLGFDSLIGAIGISFEETAKPLAVGAYSFIIPYTLVVPADASTSSFYNKTNPTAQVVVSIKDDGTEIATLTVATNGTPTWATGSNEEKTIAAGSRVSFVFPAQDSTWAGVVITLKGARSI